ncbi:aromatic ring-hydroxylating dioxygenase subunit alpha [Pusillimonas sp. DMV24BSW_D]|nr:aromatic ring-hydroxylating dioxygenase subunit alpha [Pusillimonas sp. DMV24BSW_D]
MHHTRRSLMRYLKNAWYVAALSSEVGPEDLFHRKLLGTNVLLYRKQNGDPVAMRDRCPHRFAPLHLGKRDGDQIVCHYHALKFDCTGQCTHNPHGSGNIPKAAKVPTYPLQEKYGFIWIWMGDEPADPAQLPDYSPLDNGPPTGIGYTHMHMNANYQLMIDNVMDLSHIDHVHGDAISTRGQLSPIIPEVKETERSVFARWEWKQTPPIFVLSHFLPDPQAEARHFFTVEWMPPANIQLSVGGAQGDTPFEQGVGAYDLHTCTPETEDSTHYFFATRRNHLEDDADFNAMKLKAMRDAFELEDGPIIQGVQEEMNGEEFFDLDPVLMSNDIASVKVRRNLLKLLEIEDSKTPQAETAKA